MFKEILFPIIQGWHGFDPYTQTHQKDLDASKLKFSSSQKVKGYPYR